MLTVLQIHLYSLSTRFLASRVSIIFCKPFPLQRAVLCEQKENNPRLKGHSFPDIKTIAFANKSFDSEYVQINLKIYLSDIGNSLPNFHGFPRESLFKKPSNMAVTVNPRI